MRYLLAFILSVSAFFAQAQQVNPVTDYTFANRMSSGRSTVTDTAAYFSIGPRYGAVRGMMPPMVTDTTAMSANKRNGLLIFSIQKNKYQVWDSAGAKWADITGAAGSAIISADTAAMLLPYLRKADTTAMLSPYLRGSGTANYLPIFDASRSVINSKVYQSGTNLLFNTTTASFTSTGISTIEANNTSASVFALKVLDTTRSYIASNSANTMDINNLRAGDIRFYTSATLRGRFQTDGTFRLNSLTGTGSRIVTADADGVLSATSSATGLVDTTVVSTRAWRQKGDDSLGAIIATKGSGTVTSVATGYGLSGGTITTTGTIIADSNFVASRLRVGKVVDSLALVKQNVLTNPVTGTGTTNYVPKFTGTSTIGNSQIFDNGTSVGIGVTSPTAKLHVEGPSGAGGSLLFRASRASGFGNTELFQYYVTGGTDYGSNFGLNVTSATDGRASIIFKGNAVANTGELIFNTNNTERARFNNPGELLLNTTTDAGDYKLQVSGNAYVTGTTVLAATSGNVGIGTTSPGAKLTVNLASGVNIITATGPEYAQIRHTDGTRVFFTQVYNNAANIGTESNTPLILSTNNTEKLRIHSNGGLWFQGQSSAPTATAGTVYYNSTDNKLKVYNGTTWVDLH
jgi:hypothetical protein